MDIEWFFDKMDNEFEILEEVIKETLSISQIHEKQVEVSSEFGNRSKYHK